MYACDLNCSKHKSQKLITFLTFLLLENELYWETKHMGNKQNKISESSWNFCFFLMKLKAQLTAGLKLTNY